LKHPVFQMRQASDLTFFAQNYWIFAHCPLSGSPGTQLFRELASSGGFEIYIYTFQLPQNCHPIAMLLKANKLLPASSYRAVCEMEGWVPKILDRYHNSGEYSTAPWNNALGISRSVKHVWETLLGVLSPKFRLLAFMCQNTLYPYRKVTFKLQQMYML
jgi:hypothetical protein